LGGIYTDIPPVATAMNYPGIRVRWPRVAPLFHG